MEKVTPIIDAKKAASSYDLNTHIQKYVNPFIRECDRTIKKNKSTATAIELTLPDIRLSPISLVKSDDFATLVLARIVKILKDAGYEVAISKNKRNIVISWQHEFVLHDILNCEELLDKTIVK